MTTRGSSRQKDVPHGLTAKRDALRRSNASSPVSLEETVIILVSEDTANGEGVALLAEDRDGILRDGCSPEPARRIETGGNPDAATPGDAEAAPDPMPYFEPEPPAAPSVAEGDAQQDATAADAGTRRADRRPIRRGRAVGVALGGLALILASLVATGVAQPPCLQAWDTGGPSNLGRDAWVEEVGAEVGDESEDNVAIPDGVTTLATFRCASESAATAKWAAAALDGTAIPPAATLSFLAATDGTGEEAPAMATALYICALEAGMRIDERHAGRRPVPYAPLGLDANVGQQVGDLRITNPTGATMWVTATVGTKDVEVALLGTPEPGIERAAASHVVDSVTHDAVEVYENPSDQGLSDGDVVEFVVTETHLMTYHDGTLLSDLIVSVDAYQL